MTKSSHSSPPYYYLSEAIPEFSTSDTRAYESTSSLDTVTRSHHSNTQSSAQCKDKNGSKRKKQKTSNDGLKGMEEEKKAKAAVDFKAKQTCGEYIHVRARRGQATDSHSLAERVRREKINERMKVLQSLVPGCEKVTGKALMLDEIINYVQSLQNQIEFLSLKLASVSPMCYDSDVAFDDFMSLSESQRMWTLPHEMVPGLDQQINHNQASAAFESPATIDYQMMDHSASALLHGERSNSFPQDSGGLSATRIYESTSTGVDWWQTSDGEYQHGT